MELFTELTMNTEIRGKGRSLYKDYNQEIYLLF